MTQSSSYFSMNLFQFMNQFIGRVKLKTFHNVKCVIPHQNIRIDKIKMCQSVGFAHQI